MIPKLSEALGNVRDGLKVISSESESVYNALGSAFPPLLDQMKAHLDTVSALFGAQNSNSDAASVSSTIENLQKMTQERIETFQTSFEENRILNKTLGDHLVHIHVISEKISKIREDSIAMELISLNAMTVALKAGSEGKAFSFITEELRRLASKTIAQTEFLTKRGHTLIESFSAFQKTLDDLDLKQQEILKGFAEELRPNLGGLQTALAALGEELSRYHRESVAIVPALIAIVSEIQHQDLVRQSLDHVFITLDEIDSGAQGDDESLESVSFLIALIELSGQVLEDVKSTIDSSKRVFSTRFSETNTLLAKANQARSALLQQCRPSRDPKRISPQMSSLQKSIGDLFERLLALEKSRMSSSMFTRELSKKAEDLTSSFRAFSGLITRFQTVDVSSRIEIAKGSVLKIMSGTADEMTALISEIEMDVNAASEGAGTFLVDTRALLHEFKLHLDTSRVLMDDFIEGTNADSRKTIESLETLIKNILDGEAFGKSFTAQFSQSQANMQGLTSLSDRIRRTIQSLEKMRAELQPEKQRLLREAGKTSWEVSTPRLRSIIEKFTILTHKKIAGEIAGFDVDTGKDSGEITFF